MFVDFILESFSKNKGQTALITNQISYAYWELTEKYDFWIKKISNIPESSIVAVRGEFDASSIGLMLALIEKGCVYVPLSKSIKDIESYLKIAEAEFFIEHDSLEVLRLEASVKHRILCSLKGKGVPGLILFSSGTTGDPKAAVHNFVPMLEKYKKPGKPLVSVAFLLFDHIGGVNTVLYAIANGGTLVTVDNRSPDAICALIEKYSVELLPTTPSFLNMLLFSKAYERYNLGSLKIISYGTEPMPETTLTNINAVLPAISLKQTYGLSELGIIRTKSESSQSLWLKVGGDEEHQIKISDGILWIKSTMSMIGYLNAASPFDEEGWFNTHDRVEVKGDYIRILGRDSELINVGGEKVYPAEVESVILQIDGVKDVIVKGEANPLIGNIVVCSIYTDRERDELKRTVNSHCAKHLEKFKRPVKIYFSDSAFNTERLKRKR